MVVKPESAIGAKGAIQTMKQTVDTLKAAGWTGYTKRNMTEAETAEAEKRLAEMSVTVVRRA